MKRRDLLKTSLLTLGASSLALSACNKEVAQSDELEIIPKQTATYEFSCPLPFNYKTIDEILELNSTLKKSQVVSMYNNTPKPLADRFNNWIQMVRGYNYNIKTYDDFGKYVKYAIDNGFKIHYLMNSPKGFSNEEYEKYLKNEFLFLLDYLYKIGVRDIKVASANVASLINEATNNAFNLAVSTTFELHNLPQYNHLFQNYPNFNFIDISKDENQNFKFLKALRTAYPDKKIELMATEFCMKGCPARTSHHCDMYSNRFNCGKIYAEIGDFHQFYISGAINPWDLEYYSAIGVNNFKYVNHDPELHRANFNDISKFKKYLELVEYGIDDVTIDDYFNKIFNKKILITNNCKLSELLPYMPDIKHFIAHGHECALKCGVECNYCELCAKRTENFLFG